MIFFDLLSSVDLGGVGGGGKRAKRIFAERTSDFCGTNLENGVFSGADLGRLEGVKYPSGIRCRLFNTHG